MMGFHRRKRSAKGQTKMKRVLRHVALHAAAGLVVLGLGGSNAYAATSSTVVYDSIPTVVPGNVPSQAFEATQTVEFGDKVRLGAGGRKLDKVKVTLSSWGCEGGDWTGTSGSCVTTPGSTFTHPLTLNVYSVAVGGGPGVLLATKTVTPNIPYRPSAFGAPCTGQTWSPDGGTTCFNGFATPVEWDFSAGPVVNLPSNVIWTVAYNTSHYGSPALGELACFTESGGCGYDSLNVGVFTFAGSPFVGADLDDEGAVLNTGYAPFYCDGGAGGVGTLRADTSPGCWTGYRPLAEITTIQTSNTLVVKPDANLGWFVLADGTVAATSGNATGSIVPGPGGQVGLLGGSVLYNTNSGPGGKPQLFAPTAVSGTKFADVTSLDYRTFISRYATDAGGSHLTHTLNVGIDLDGITGGTDQKTLVYEPCYTVNSCVGPVQPLNTWTTWTPLAPGQIWWSTTAIPGTAFTAGPSFVPLDSLYAAYPDATILYWLVQAGQGSGGPPWNNFTGNLDGATFGASGTSTVYDFEPLTGATPGTLVLGSASLRIARTGFDSGSGSIAGTLRATDTQAGFEAAAVAGLLTLRLRDGAAYDATVPVTGCAVVGTRRNIACRSLDRKVTARFRTVLGPFLGQFVYAMTARVSMLPVSATGLLPPGPTVTATLHESPGIDRTDTIGDRPTFPCIQAAKTIRCRER
jgi:hypothetical protein